MKQQIVSPFRTETWALLQTVKRIKKAEWSSKSGSIPDIWLLVAVHLPLAKLSHYTLKHAE